MKSVQKIDLGLTGYDELFMNDAERKENKLPRIYDIPLSEIDDFPDHPFKVKLDEDMDQLVQSIKERGIITPVTLRPKEDGRYEIVSGHRRRKACELAGFDTVKAEVREMTRDETIILMVESNLQRSVILPSEKAFSYKMRLEAMNRQGQRTDLTSVPVAQKSTSRELLGKEVGESQDQVRRYIRLTELIPELLDLVDEGRIAFRPAVELSYLQKEEQGALLEQISYADATPSLAQAIKLKRFSQDGKLNNEVIESIMSEEKPNQREKINIKYAEARRFIPASVPYEKTGEYTLITTTPPGMWTETETSGAMTPTMTARTTISIGCIRTMFPRHRKTGSKKKSTTAQPPEQISSVSPADLAMRSGRCTAGAFLADRKNEVRHDEPSTAERKLYCQAGLFGFQRKSLQQR